LYKYVIFDIICLKVGEISMFYALNSYGEKIDIEDSIPNIEYYCPLCKSRLIRKMGEINIHHFAHVKNSNCDPWYDAMSEWHRRWQSIFPKENQEVILSNEYSKHISDVCLKDTVIEFQHSSIPLKDLNERNEFYLSTRKHLVWVVDCFGKDISIVTNDTRYIYRDQINAEARLTITKPIPLTWKYRRRTYDELYKTPNVKLYLHINEYHIIEVTKINDWVGLQDFEGRLLTIDEFLISLGRYNYGEVYLSNGMFNGYNEKFRRQYDVDKWLSAQREAFRLGYSKYKINKKLRMIFSNYLKGNISYEDIKQDKRIYFGHRRPSNDNTYFYEWKPSPRLDKL